MVFSLDFWKVICKPLELSCLIEVFWFAGVLGSPQAVCQCDLRWRRLAYEVTSQPLEGLEIEISYRVSQTCLHDGVPMISGHYTQVGCPGW